jgi:hypothetical protein
MRAVKGNLGHSPKERWRELKGPYPACSGGLVRATTAQHRQTSSEEPSLVARCSLARGKGASQGEEAVLADSGREGEIAARVGRVRSPAILSILRDRSLVVLPVRTIDVLACQQSFSTACWI